MKKHMSGDHTTNSSENNLNCLITFDILETAKLLGAHKETVRRLAASGKLLGVKIGRGCRFIEQDLELYMRSQYSGGLHRKALLLGVMKNGALQKEQILVG